MADSTSIEASPWGRIRQAVELVLSKPVPAGLTYAYCLGSVCLFLMANQLVTPEGIKPEWYFLWAYQLLKYFPATVGPVSGKVLGLLACAALSGVLVILPLLDRGPQRQRERAVALAVVILLVLVALTLLGWASERELTLFGRRWHVDVLGVPRRAP